MTICKECNKNGKCELQNMNCMDTVIACVDFEKNEFMRLIKPL